MICAAPWVNRGIVVVVSNVSQDFSTVIVVTSAQPRAAISPAMSASSSKPCTMESTPAAAQTRVPASRVACAVTLRPRACTVCTTRVTSSALNGGVSASGPSR